MLQDIFRFNLFGYEIPIHGFGVMTVIGFLGALFLGKYLFRRSGLNPDVFEQACMLALFTGFLGARLSHVLEHLSEFTRADRSAWANLKDVFNIGSGGLTYYGGFLLAFPTLVVYALWKKVPLRLGMDIVAPCLMVGLAMGRVGCFLNGCCYGAACDLPWAVQFPYGSYAYEDQAHHGKIDPPAELIAPGTKRLLTTKELREGYSLRRDPLDPSQQIKTPIHPHARELAAQQRSLLLHPAQLYSTVTALLLAAVLVAYLTVPHTPGMVFALMLTLEGIARFILELLRVEPAVTHAGGLGLSLSMIIGIGLAIFGVFLGWLFSRQGGSSIAPNLAAAPA